MEYRYKPSDMVCSQEMLIELDGDIIKKVTIIGGCAGNTLGLSNLIQGMNIDEAIKCMINLESMIKVLVFLEIILE